jgi:hypothetical protein
MKKAANKPAKKQEIGEGEREDIMEARKRLEDKQPKP